MPRGAGRSRSAQAAEHVMLCVAERTTCQPLPALQPSSCGIWPMRPSSSIWLQHGECRARAGWIRRHGKLAVMPRSSSLRTGQMFWTRQRTLSRDGCPPRTTRSASCTRPCRCASPPAPCFHSRMWLSPPAGGRHQKCLQRVRKGGGKELAAALWPCGQRPARSAWRSGAAV